VLAAYDDLWGAPFPYVLVVHQAPTDGKPHPGAHVHIEIYPPYRMRGRLKYLAGSELYNGGHVLPIAIARVTRVELALRPDGRVRA
jgi:galactose-1-phosphate uridylyltransferase